MLRIDRIWRSLAAGPVAMVLAAGAAGIAFAAGANDARRAHGEGFAEFRDAAQFAAAEPFVALRFADNRGQATERYPFNANGSPGGITGLSTVDGRHTILMPHPERVFRTVQMSWHPDGWGEDSPWMRMFRNARAWLG